ncbi:Inactive hydroxysteroid dehydrogenase-like protein 1 [Amphibalanus amphitrite]|uniref:Inactive hydroxysteroid dehydrogenase-like protein 1 n=1 Tax=Amphibalanus amphitrite TaxID=1232801 RepID=A0A6A4V6T5_AMPAM|nr:inactive hydroxysteroid dehydrogenase-like protein 1 isoform X1 [Amphibalanus amphitrite]KAF0287274.1 Inactive hydroxysteroid dehydrogenase-like protein 1 [Amphibalanus amphitrite]
MSSYAGALVGTGSYITVKNALAAIGAITSLKILIKFIRFVYSLIRGHFLPRFTRTSVLQHGKWAVVTGCTDGVGRAYARELARRGCSMVLISRSQQKLDDFAGELRHEFGSEVVTVAADFSQGRQVYGPIEEKTRGLDIGILVNNVGVMLPYPMRHADVSEEDVWRHVLVNVAPAAALSRLVLPGMVARGRGAVVNISSSSAIGPMPHMNIYSASKKFLEYFSRALAAEYRPYGVTVQTVMPFYIATNMTSYSDKIGRANLFVPDAPTFADSCVRTLGRLESTTGYWTHELQYFVCSNVPSWLWMSLGEELQKELRRDAIGKQKSS